MTAINIPAENDTFISSYYPTGNYSDFDYLLVNMSLEDPYQYTSSLMQFNLSPLINKLHDIASMRLHLFVDSIDFDSVNFDILLNIYDYDYSTVTWQTRPNASEIITAVSINKDFFHKYIEIDITDRLKKYIISSNNTTLGLTLLMSNPLGGITIGSSRHYKPPFLKAYFIDENSYITSTDTHNPNITDPSIVRFDMISNLDPIIFNKDNIIGKQLFSFDISSGYFTVQTPGSYLLKWSVGIKEACNVNSISFSVLDDSGSTLSSISVSPKTPLELNGSILIKITKLNCRFTIINTSGDTLTLVSNPTTKANIELIKV